MCRDCAGNLFGSIGIKPPQMTRRTFAAVAVGAMGAGLTAPARAAAGSDSDVIFRGGSVIPLSGGKRYAEALAVSAGRIVAVGSEAEVAQRKGASTRVVDLDGRTLLPGFIDPHQHTVTGALVAAVFTEIGYTAYKTRAAVMSALRQRAAQTPPGKWLLFADFDNLLQGGDLSKAELDAISTDHPILVYYINMHTATANSAALQAAGVTENTGPLPGGGRFGRNPDGTLNGMVYEETALKKFMIGFPKITPELAGRATIDWLKKNAAVGNTTVHEAGVLVFGNILEGYQRVATQSPCRASISLMFESMDKAEPYKAYGYGARATQVPDSLLSLYAMKIVGDGSNQTKTAAQTVPYLHSSEKGRPNFDAAELKRMVAEVKAAGWPISIHCNGDATLDIALDAIEDGLRRQSDDRGQPHRTLHHRAARPDYAHGQDRRAAELSDQPRLLLRRRLPRRPVRPGARRADGRRGGFHQGRIALHAAHRCAMLQYRHVAEHPDRGNPPLPCRRFDRRRGASDFAHRCAQGRDHPCRRPDRDGGADRVAARSARKPI